MTPKAVQKPRMTSEERKACIVEAACKLFADKGFRGTTTRELAAAVGVTEPVLYEHFSTKRDLYSAIIEAKAEAGMDFLTELLEDHAATRDDVGYFNKLGEGIIDWYTTDPGFVRLLLFSSLEGHELKELFHQRTVCCFDMIASYIAQRVEQGAFREVDSRVAARSFFGMVAHYALTGLVFGCAPFSRPPKEIVAEMVSIFLGGMYKDKTK